MTIEPSSNVVENDDNFAPEHIATPPGVTTSQTLGLSDDSDEALFTKPSAFNEEMVEYSRNRSTTSSAKRTSQEKGQTLVDQPSTTVQQATASKIIKIIDPKPSTSNALPNSPSTSNELPPTLDLETSNAGQQTNVETQPPTEVSTQITQQTREL